MPFIWFVYHFYYSALNLNINVLKTISNKLFKIEYEMFQYFFFNHKTMKLQKHFFLNDDLPCYEFLMCLYLQKREVSDSVDNLLSYLGSIFDSTSLSRDDKWLVSFECHPSRSLIRDWHPSYTGCLLKQFVSYSCI